MLNKNLLQWLNIITFVATFAINYLATGLELGGYNAGELSDLIPNLFVPIGLTFSIWGVIYFFLAAFSMYQGRDIFKENKIDMPYVEKVGYWFIISNVANAAWIFFWHFQVILPFALIYSLIVMIIILLSLIMIYLRLEIGKADVSRGERAWIHTPFSIYLGWITVATIANITAVLVTYGVAPFGPIAEFLTIFVIIVAVIITYLMLILRKDWVYSLVIVWATLGIYLKQSTGNLTIAITALIAVIVVAIGIIFTGYRILKK